MAWRSGGNTNDEMCNQLSRNGIILKPDVLEAFRRVDRGLFVPEDASQSAYDDAPLRHNGIHMSAPHIYGTIMDALDMKVGHSFLNIGSGTGYISSIAAVLGGPTSLNHGIEINREVHKFAIERTESFRDYYRQKFGNGIAEIRLCCGNVFDLEEFSHRDELPAAIPIPTPVLATRLFDSSQNTVTWARSTISSNSNSTNSSMSQISDEVEIQMNDRNILLTPQRTRSESSCSSSSSTTLSSGSRSRSCSVVSNVSASDFVMYDRIYVGAACSSILKQRLLSCLSLGGILVAPVEDELLKIMRVDEGSDESCFISTLLCGVRFVDLTPSSGTSPNIRLPKLEKLPRTQWSPQTHVVFPKSFKRSCFAVLTAARHDDATQRIPQLPHVIWLEILSFTSRGWFDKLPSESEKLTLKLDVEKNRREKAEQEAYDARIAQRTAEQECARWRVLTHRLERQLRDALSREESLTASYTNTTSTSTQSRDTRNSGFGNFFLRNNLISFAASSIRPAVRDLEQHLDDEVEVESEEDFLQEDETHRIETEEYNGYQSHEEFTDNEEEDDEGTESEETEEEEEEENNCDEEGDTEEVEVEESDSEADHADSENENESSQIELRFGSIDDIIEDTEDTFINTNDTSNEFSNNDTLEEVLNQHQMNQEAEVYWMNLGV